MVTLIPLQSLCHFPQEKQQTTVSQTIFLLFKERILSKTLLQVKPLNR